MNGRVNMSQERAAIAEGCTLDYVTRTADITGRAYYPPLLGTAEAASGIWHPVLDPVEDRCGGTQEDPADSNQDGQALQQVTCGKRLRVSGLLSPAERRLIGNLIAACSYLKGGCKDDEAKLFLAVPDGIISDNDLRLWLGNFRLDTLPGVGNAAWIRLPRKVVESHPWVFPRLG